MKNRIILSFCSGLYCSGLASASASACMLLSCWSSFNCNKKSRLNFLFVIACSFFVKIIAVSTVAVGDVLSRNCLFFSASSTLYPKFPLLSPLVTSIARTY